MELLRQIWQWFVDHPEVTWSGAGIYVLSGVTAILGGIASWLFWKKKYSSSQQETDNDLSVCPPRLRQQLLKRFRNDLDLRLSSLLDERTPLDLEKKLSPHEVDRPHSLRDILYEQEGRAPQVTDLSIIDIFQDKESGERLAILGKPGSGKTISLLQLHDHLLKRAEEEEQESLPVIFECSEWDGKDLVDWMGRQLSKNYRGLQEELAKELVRDEVIFPLFDGLDELLQSRQDKFVQAFNKFQTGRSLVVCCRLEEYRCLQKKVDLNHAVILQDISEKKLEGYLKQLQLYGLWDFLQQSQKEGEENSLLELARRPLFLNIMLTLENERSLSQDEGLRRGKQAENRLWELYLDYCLKKKTPSKKNRSEKYWKQYSKDHSIRWLYCLANRIKTEGKVEFRLDELHPDCLYHIWKFKVSYGLLSGIPLGLIIMSFLNSAFGLRIIPLWMAYVLLRDEQVVKQDEIIRLGYPSTLYDWKKVFSGLLME
ncbi:MAG: NACHT domain-containing protein [Candidatus Electrothrix sp. Rat3]|nr:NACHT domain-containing protein [Candidatus Electrothrix rattekaaiensis]